MKQSYHFFFVLVDVSPRNCGRMPPLVATQAMSARALFPIPCLVVSFLMPYFILFHVLSSPISCLVVAFLMPYFILFHVLSSPIPCLVVSFLMPYFIQFHVLSSPIPCLVVSFLMSYFILFHVLSSPISCLVVSSSFAVAQPILSQISSRPRRVAADLREGHNQVQVDTQKPLPFDPKSRGGVAHTGG